MASNALFSDQDIQAAGGQPQQQSGQTQTAPQPSGSLFSADEIQAAGQDQPQPGFLQRAAQTSGVSGLWDTVSNFLHSVAAEPQQDFQDTLAARDAAAAQLKQGDLLGAARTIVGHLAKHTAMTAMPGAPTFVRTATNTGEQIADNTVTNAKRAVSAASAGDTGAAVQSAAAAVPVVGQVAGPAVEDYRKGNYAGLAGDVAGAVIQALVARGLLKGAAAEEAAGEEAAAEPSTMSKAVGAVSNITKDIPAHVEGNLVDALGDIAEKNGLERPEADTARGAVADIANQYKARAQSVYQQLDEEAPGFQELRDQIAKQQKALRVQENIDPEKAGEIEANLNKMRDTMSDLLNEGQKQRWDAADADYSRYRAMQQFGRKVTAAGEDLTSDELTNVEKLQGGMRALSNATKRGNPVDVLDRAFGPDADTLKGIVQESVENLSKQQAGRTLLKWLAIGASPVVGGTVLHHYGVIGGGN